MSHEEERRLELARFLRDRREQATREGFGLPNGGRGRTSGLRREEVASLSGVSVTWYTWLEQGRSINPSRQVIDALARTFRLNPAETDYLLSLAGFGAAPARVTSLVEDAPPHVQHLLDALGVNPAFALAPDWGIVGWNAAYAELYPSVAHTAREDRNLIWVVYSDPGVRELLPDWEETSARFLAEFRAQTALRAGDPQIHALVSRLNATSAEFRQAWERYSISGFQSRERRFMHPLRGEIRLEHHELTPLDRPDLRIVVYTPLGEPATPKAPSS